MCVYPDLFSSGTSVFRFHGFEVKQEKEMRSLQSIQFSVPKSPETVFLIATAQFGTKRICIDGKQSGSRSHQMILGSHL